MRGTPLSALIFLPFLLAPGTSFAQSDWVATKCALYEKAWSRATSNAPPGWISETFAASNLQFIASGCTAKIPVCPRTNTERDMADFLTIAMLNEGAASTFLPFSCDDE